MNGTGTRTEEISWICGSEGNTEMQYKLRGSRVAAVGPRRRTAELTRCHCLSLSLPLLAPLLPARGKNYADLIVQYWRLNSKWARTFFTA